MNICTHSRSYTTHYLRPTKLDNTLATYICGYYRVLSYNKKDNNNCQVCICVGQLALLWFLIGYLDGLY